MASGISKVHEPAQGKAHNLGATPDPIPFGSPKEACKSIRQTTRYPGATCRSILTYFSVSKIDLQVGLADRSVSGIDPQVGVERPRDLPVHSAA
jgi:hypothetical protein